MKFLNAAILLLAFLLISCGSGGGPENSEANGTNKQESSKLALIKDANLTAVIRQALDKPEGDLTRNDLATLEKLVANGQGISDLSGLEHATSLLHLDLGTNPISDLSPLSKLTKLTFLELGSCRIISDITPLAGLKNLKQLGLWSNDITDISALEGLTNLEKVSLFRTKVTDITPLAKLTKLKTVEFRESHVKDHSVLAGLTNLESVATNRGLISDEQLTMLQKALPNCKFEF
jgi:internalin A